MCFFVMMGIVPREKRIGTEMRYCSYCGREELHVLYERRMWFTLFFIPLFPVSGKQIIARCESCGLEPAQQEFMRHVPTAGSLADTCPRCGSAVSPDANYCHYCGRQLR